MIQEKFLEVQNYFKAKLLNNEFEVGEIKEYEIQLKIDGFDFWIWIGNIDLPYTRNQKNCSTQSAILLSLDKEESIDLDKLISPIVQEHRKTILLEKKQKEIENLQKEIESYKTN